MKKIRLTLTALGLPLILFSGCQTVQPKTSDILSVSPYESTEETQQLLNLFPDSFSTYIFDYTLDASATRITLTLQILNADKEWKIKEAPEISDPLSGSGKILIQYTQKGELNYSILGNDGAGAYWSTDDLSLDLNAHEIRAYLPQRQKVVGELGQPIPLALIASKDGLSMESADLESALSNPEQLDCDQALLVTLTFSK